MYFWILYDFNHREVYTHIFAYDSYIVISPINVCVFPYSQNREKCKSTKRDLDKNFDTDKIYIIFTE